MAEDEMQCWECNGRYSYKMADFSVYGISLGKFKAKVCNKCGDKVFGEEVSGQMDKIAKQRGLWGLEAKTKIGRVGNALDVKISTKIAKFCELKKGREVSVRPEGKNKILIEVIAA
ncbi:hypothetical protein HYU06_03580 [Candidatus Woesearchaeota archaeon]|nr:hypothetical protein [Candidatus Woesearchaeota archaeon]